MSGEIGSAQAHLLNPAMEDLAPASWRSLTEPYRPVLPLLIGGAIFLLSLLISIARQSWVSEDAAHSPIILAIGSWLLVRRFRQVHDPAAAGGSLGLALLLLVPAAAAHVIARSLDWTTIAGYTAWLSLVVVGYGMFGWRTLRRLAFPILYLLLALPLPAGTTVALTHDVRLLLSDLAVRIVALFDYPVAGTGITIFIDRYELLVEDACSGLNSVLSLTAVGLFYAYVRYGSSLAYTALLTLLMAMLALLANLLRIIVLMLVTYHSGDAAAKGLLHDATGIILFAGTVFAMFAFDRLLGPVRRALGVGP